MVHKSYIVSSPQLSLFGRAGYELMPTNSYPTSTKYRYVQKLYNLSFGWSDTIIRLGTLSCLCRSGHDPYGGLVWKRVKSRSQTDNLVPRHLRVWEFPYLVKTVLFEEGGYKAVGIILRRAVIKKAVLLQESGLRGNGYWTGIVNFRIPIIWGGVSSDQVNFEIRTNFNHHKLKTQRLPNQFARRQKVYAAVDHLPVHVYTSLFK